MIDTLEDFKTKSQHIIVNFKRELSNIRTSRPTSALVEDLKVEYYGKLSPISSVGSIGVEPPRDIIIQVWDKAAIQQVVKAIETSSLGLSVSVQGNVIRVHLPELSEERREEIAKHVKRITENYRIQVRSFRDEANKSVQKSFEEGILDEDRKFKLKKEIQDETDKVNKEIEKLLENKIKEIQQ
ncbi:MAG: ribosome recycling factor [Patescibacteria group bacterium]|nr:ribosome recycling factor [Patescibacteria group bacterium]